MFCRFCISQDYDVPVKFFIFIVFYNPTPINFVVQLEIMLLFRYFLGYSLGKCSPAWHNWFGCHCFKVPFRGPLANQHFTDNITCLEYYIAALLINLFEVVTKIIIFDR